MKNIIAFSIILVFLMMSCSKSDYPFTGTYIGKMQYKRFYVDPYKGIIKIDSTYSDTAMVVETSEYITFKNDIAIPKSQTGNSNSISYEYGGGGSEYTLIAPDSIYYKSSIIPKSSGGTNQTVYIFRGKKAF
jgi:hypothetical protein